MVLLLQPLWIFLLITVLIPMPVLIPDLLSLAIALTATLAAALTATLAAALTATLTAALAATLTAALAAATTAASGENKRILQHTGRRTALRTQGKGFLRI
jgi:membrane protein implicated in regulation of membrane protease activity